MRSGRLDVSMALPLGIPVIASDIATFQEITQSCALLLSPLDECGGKRQRADIMVSVVSVIETLPAARRARSSVQVLHHEAGIQFPDKDLLRTKLFVLLLLDLCRMVSETNLLKIHRGFWNL